MKWLLIMNPGSRSGKGKSRWALWENALLKEQIPFDVVTTLSLPHAFELARDAKQDYSAIIAVGGDGTINAVADGMMHSPYQGRAMGILYAGTSPDFCRYHGIPTLPEDAVLALLKQNTQMIDIAQIKYHDQHQNLCVSHFLCSCNIGLGALIARNANRLRKYVGDHVGTGLAALYSFFVNKPADIELYMDGERFSFEKNNNFSILINPYIASGLKLDMVKEKDAGYLVLLGVNKKNKVQLLKLLPKFYNGKIVQDKSIFLSQCQAIKISSAQALEVEFDGDPHGFLPLEINLLPRSFKLMGMLDENRI